MKLICGALTLILSLVFINLAGAQQAKEQPKKEQPKKEKVLEVGKGINIDSSLGDKDQKDARRQGSYSKVFLVKLVKGKTYQIDMRTAAFDAYLRLENAKKTQLAEDDDSGGDLDAQILFTPTEDGVYRIITTSFNEDETGPFNLRIEEK
jgi:hypothetical protein